MSAWYRVCLGRIEPIEVERCTDNFVFIGGRRRARSSDWDSYHPSWQAAHEWMLSDAKRRVSNAESELDREKSNLKRVLELKP